MGRGCRPFHGAARARCRYFNSKGLAKVGKYDVVSTLGEGATSTVYLCRDSFANREVAVKVRSLSRPVPATLEDGLIRFHQPEYGVAPGQAAVVYDGDRLLGGGWIERTVSATASAPLRAVA